MGMANRVFNTAVHVSGIGASLGSKPLSSIGREASSAIKESFEMGYNRGRSFFSSVRPAEGNITRGPIIKKPEFKRYGSGGRSFFGGGSVRPVTAAGSAGGGGGDTIINKAGAFFGDFGNSVNRAFNNFKPQANAIFNQMEKTPFVSKHLYWGGAGAAFGALSGAAGSIFAPNVVTSDQNMFGNAMKGAALGFGMGLVHTGARAINKVGAGTLSPWMHKGANMTEKALDHWATKGALMAAGAASMAEGHLTEANNRIRSV